MKVVENLAQLIGDTPLLKLNKIGPKNGATIYGKLEFLILAKA